MLKEKKSYRSLVQIIAAFMFLVPNCLGIGADAEETERNDNSFQKGVCLIAWEKDRFASPGAKQALDRIRNMGAEYIQINVTKYQERYNSFKIRSTERTPSNSSVIRAIKEAHKIGLKVMLKPHIDVLNKGGGNYCRMDIGFADDKSWEKWFKEYENFIAGYAEMAERENVEILCIGTELSFASRKKEFWRRLVLSVRNIYSGKLIYAANWDNYQNIEFWEELDLIGINAYFPLTQESCPTIEEIKKGWRRWINEIESWHSKIDKPIVFTEIGYASCKHAASQPWTGGTGKADVDIQARCYTAFFEVIWWRSWIQGVYWWNFKPMIYGGGRRNRGFTPMNKPAEKILEKWYKSERIALKSPEEKLKALEINFANPKNLHNKYIQFKIKSLEKVETIRFVLRDKSTRCSPDIYLDNITDRWQTIAINVEEQTFGYIDTSRIDGIKFEILSPEYSEKNTASMLLIEEIKIF